MPEHATPAPFASADLDGRLLAGRYRVGEVIASGGMAQVRRATDDVLGRAVAVKILHPHLATDPVLVDRFKREAVAAARLTHPNIVGIYDTVAEGGINAIVMELITGITLRQYLDQEGPLAPQDTVDVIAGVAAALQVAHEAGIVHRDVKPANILLCDDRRVKVTDFGIAKATVGSDLTQTGTMIGTAKYLAPEQVRGERVDPRTDVYALGVVLFECLTGKAPFEGDSDAATALARLHRDPLRPRQIRPSVPKSLDTVTMQALCREPDGRPPTADALRAALLAAGSDDATATLDRDHTIAAPLAAAAVEPESFARAERRWLVPIMLVLLIGGALSLAGVLIGQTEAGQQLIERARDVVTQSGGNPAGDTPLDVLAVSAFDPIGGDGENDDQVGAAVDGDPETSWPTEFYDVDTWSRKDGVGLVVEVGAPLPLHSVEVTSPTNAWAADIYVAAVPHGSLADWGEPVARRTGVAAGSEQISLDGVEGGAVLLWFTDLGDGPANALHMRVADVTVRGG
ncbi:MAG: protein kinase domain-containing protein [Acidimicrobiales bacterium]